MEHYEERLDHLEAQVTGLLKHIEKLHRTNIDLAAQLNKSLKELNQLKAGK